MGKNQGKGSGSPCSYGICDAVTFSSSSETDTGRMACWPGHHAVSTVAHRGCVTVATLAVGEGNDCRNTFCCLLVGRQSRLQSTFDSPLRRGVQP